MSATEPKLDGSGEIIEGTAVEVYHAPPPPSLFRTDDPVEIIERATRVADALKGVIVKQRLFKSINGRDHVLVEGWTTLGSMLGVVPVATWSRRIEPAIRYDVEVVHYEWVDKRKREKARSHYTVEGYDWEARVEARTMDGRTIGAAEAMCSRGELTWAKREDYALRSMAQTRATSKALRGPLGFIVALAGYATTPFEEMPNETEPPNERKATTQPIAEPERASIDQKREIDARAVELELTDAEFANCFKIAAGEPPVIWQDGAAQRWVIKALDRLPARLVDAVMAELDRKAALSR
ncbi:MAG: hypothetical protein ACLP50_32210 [Solirubrobacteraceae bacterium]